MNSRPPPDFEDPAEVEAIWEAKEASHSFNLKSARDYVVPEQHRMNVAKATDEIASMRQAVRIWRFEKKTTTFDHFWHFFATDKFSKLFETFSPKDRETKARFSYQLRPSLVANCVNCLAFTPPHCMTYVTSFSENCQSSESVLRWLSHRRLTNAAARS